MKAHKLQINVLNVITITTTPRHVSSNTHNRNNNKPLRHLRLFGFLLLPPLLLLLLAILLLLVRSDVGLLWSHTDPHSPSSDVGNNVTIGYLHYLATQNLHKLSENPKSERVLRTTAGLHQRMLKNTTPSSVNNNNNNTKSYHESASQVVLQSHATTNEPGTYRHQGVWEMRNRAKRFILFRGGGVVKFVIGLSFPIMLADKQRSLSYFYNLQFVYTPPPEPVYWWSFFNTSTFAARHQQRRMVELSTERPKRLSYSKRDLSREFIYKAIENIFERHHLPGVPCLLRLICEVSQLPFYTTQPKESLLSTTIKSWQVQNVQDLLHAMLNAIFSPSLPNVDTKYLDAHRAGQNGGDCTRTFSDCPPHISKWLRRVMHII